MDGHKKGMKPRAIILFVTLHLTMHSIDSASVLADFVNFVNFGSGGNTFTMEFVEVGNPGNTADTTESPSPAGAISYAYQIGKYEVSRNMIDLYNTNFGTANSLAITMHNMTSYGGNGSNKPATGVSWNEAARFVNWLNTSHGYSATYKFSTSGATDNTAVVIEATATGPADVDQAGGLNAYGIMGLSGNVYEWEESSFDQTNSSPTLNRSRRGGSWATTNVNYLSSSLRQGLWQ